MSKTIFTKVDYSLSGLVDAISLGSIGLPDIQRPFVWKNAKVRNLFDSMYRGYPVGYLLFWENGTAGAKSIGAEKKQVVPNLLIVDGQQRLTAIYAVVKGIPVVRENYQSEDIAIAFNPLEEKFEVADAAIRRDKAFIPNISALWSAEFDIFDVVEEYLQKNATADRALTPDETKRAKDAISRLSSITHYPFTALQLAPNVGEEQVSQVFVRINSEGKPLNQSDFILTLMSVFWDEGRTELEKFCRDARTPTTGKASPFNHFIQPDPDQLLRTSVNVGFRRARLSHVYNILRGKDLETQEFSAERRVEQFAVLKKAQTRVLDLLHWHDFLKCLVLAGFRSSSMIGSKNAVVFAYSLYLLGRTEFGVKDPILRRVIAQWFFMSALTGRYSSSPESSMEFDLARLRTIKSADEFVAVLRQVSNSVLTKDYWEISLPNELATASARSPSLFAYFAALNLLGARVLFSKHAVSELMDPALNSTRSPLERHHLFPKKYLKGTGTTDNRDINQVANFTFIEWGDNAAISDKSPAEYVPLLSKQFAKKELDNMARWHALPNAWERMPYGEFLQKRRELMAGVITDGYEKLAHEAADGGGADTVVPLEALIAVGESTAVEFKSTLRVNLHTGQIDSKIELAVLKTLAGFLNTNGGTLVIGVDDYGTPLGLDADKFPNEDKMSLHLINLVKDRIGPQHMIYMHPRFEDLEGNRVFAVGCEGAKAPVYVKDGGTERFYMRTGAATTELSASQMTEFIKRRFG